MLSVDTHVVMADPAVPVKRVGELVVGDRILGEDGTPVRVTGVGAAENTRGIELSFKNSGRLVVSHDHVFNLIGEKTLRRPEVQHSSMHLMTFRDLVVTAEELALDVAGVHRAYGYAVPVAPPVTFLSSSDGELNPDPYLVGAYISRGTRPGMMQTREWNEAYLCKLTKMDAVHNKFVMDMFTLHENHGSKLNLDIPLRYLMGTFEQRKRLLAGVCDNKAAQSNRRQIYVSTSNKNLLLSLNLLLNFQGQRNTIIDAKGAGRPGRVLWTATESPFLLRDVDLPDGVQSRSSQYRTITKASRVLGDIAVRSVEVDGPGFLAARNLIPVNGE